ncbi:HNH endonuclease [Neobacillus sp. NPDC093127]|uniref:HNH endonuclease n=1 Tax=Neobacillus sp. NPDC093127 TaxID=3364296 RepID=UPI0037F22C5A
MLKSRGYNICVKWDSESRTWYARSKDKRVHRLIKGEPVGMHVHHIEGNGLNNTRENLEVVTPSEHARKKHPKGPIKGDPSKGIKVHILTKAGRSRKKPSTLNWFRLEVNGLHYGTFDSETNISLHNKVADMVVNENATNEQIYSWVLRLGHDKEHVAAVIKDVRRFFCTPDPSKKMLIKVGD